MKQLLVVITTFFIAVGCATTHQFGPPGETKLEEKTIDRMAALASLPPRIQGCITSTPDYLVTGSETTVSGDEHCFPATVVVVSARGYNQIGLGKVVRTRTNVG